MILIKRVIAFLLIAFILVSSITLSGLNTDKVHLDLYFFNFDINLGFLLILTLIIGLIMGLFIFLLGYYLPMKSQLRKTSRQNKQLMQQNRLSHD